MALSLDATKRLIESLASQDAGNEVATILNRSSSGQAQAAWTMAAVIVATNVSATIDFAALKVGDQLVHIPAVAGNAAFETVATAATKPSAAVVGDLYVALRALPTVAASAVIL